MPFGIDKLINLQRLSDFIIGEGDGHHIRVLKYFSNLKGDIRFSGLENVNCQDAREAKVNEKQGIDRLVLHWSKNFYKDSRNKEHEEWVLGSLCPPKKLEQLVIKNYSGAKFSTWIADSSFKNMLSLGLGNCKNCKSLPSIARLSLLKDLTICGLDELHKIGVELFGVYQSNAFTSLETVLRVCQIGRSGIHMKKLEIYECGRLVVSISCFSSLCELIIDGCEELVDEGSSSAEEEAFDISSWKEFGIFTAKWVKLTRASFSYDCPVLVFAFVMHSFPRKLKTLKRQLTKSKNQAVRDQDFEKAGELRDREITLRAQITAVQEKDKGMNKGVEGSLVVTEADIQHIVSSWTGIPVEKVSTDEFDRLLKMEETLHKRVVGQDEAVKAINRAIRRARVGLKNPRPIASFIYSGPTGVGNSELAKNLQYLIDEKENNNTINNVCLLEHLDISDCHSLIWLSSTDISFPEEGFPTNLTSLKVSKEPRIYTSLVEWGFNRLTSLPELIISGEGCPNVVSFPEEGIVITLPPLTFIFIQKFENLEYMWFMGFQHLTSLQQLQIYTCPKLTSLPEKDMLLSLEHLLIYNCPLLEEGCSRGKGREWSKVAHIPYVQIDVPTVISRGLD
ncbi:hypothetical protein GOBAR_AA06464 [Gossypium barbadense]|uniref:UVR domain-containing protein n=1 Tax=Gossypium barbadense TaxID=3634 RepID=A0A2P5YEZ3_GOSBA|nr:hypothetical protein GOBAR_AA06464 [Gossypium barbadense]